MILDGKKKDFYDMRTSQKNDIKKGGRHMVF